MSAGVSEYELEALPELGAGYAGELEGDRESEQFFGALSNLARRGAGLAVSVAQRALNRGLPGLGRPEGPLGCTLTQEGDCASVGCNSPNRCVKKCVLFVGPLCIQPYCVCQESQKEYEWESEFEVNPIRKIYPDAMLEHLGHAAAETHSEAEAESLAGAMIPLAARIIPLAAPALMRAMPGLASGVAGVVRSLHRNPATRPLLRVVPAIVRGTASTIAQQASRGVPVTPQGAVRALARQTLRVLGSPQRSAQAFRRSRVLDRQLHRTGGVSQQGRASTCPSCGAKVR